MLEHGFDAIEQYPFLFPVECSEFRRPLEHHVLEIVSKPCVIGGVVLATGAHCEGGLDAGCNLVAAQVDLQAVLQGVHANTQRVIGDILIRVAVALCSSGFVGRFRLPASDQQEQKESGKKGFMMHRRKCLSPNYAKNRQNITHCIFRLPHSRISRSEEHTSELQSRENILCHLLIEKK